MSHYKSNLRDIEFNLFEVLGRDEVLGQGPFAEVDGGDRPRDPRRGRPRLRARTSPRRTSTATATRRSSTPRPTPLPCRSRSRRATRPGWTRSTGASRSARSSAAPPPPPRLVWAIGEMVLGANAPCGCMPPARRSPASSTPTATSATRRVAEIMVDRQWPCTMVLTEPDAGSDVGRRSHQGHAQRGRLVEHHRRQALHHLRRGRPERQHHAPRAGPPRGRGGRRRPRAPRACRCSGCRPTTSTTRPAS